MSMNRYSNCGMKSNQLTLMVGDPLAGRAEHGFAVPAANAKLLRNRANKTKHVRECI